jgi:DNA-binding NarL/FixJ family response regulator
MKPKSKAPHAAEKKRILIVDDHPMMRQGLIRLIENEPDLAVCGEAENAGQAFDRVESLQPDLVLLDITLPDKSGLELIKDISAVHPDMAILVISMHDESLYAERVLRAGGRGYVMKQEGGRKLMEAIRRVIEGKICVSEKMSAQILEAFSGHRAQVQTSPVQALTDRELEVFQLIGLGKSTKETAERLHISTKTVEVHRANIKNKLQIQSGPELIRYAVRWVETQQPG